MDIFLRRQHSLEKDSICQREQGHKRKKKQQTSFPFCSSLFLKCQLPHRKEQFGLCAVTIAISSQGHQFREAHGPAALIIRVTSECWIWIFDSGSSFGVIAAPIHGMEGPQFFSLSYCFLHCLCLIQFRCKYLVSQLQELMILHCIFLLRNITNSASIKTYSFSVMIYPISFQRWQLICSLNSNCYHKIS